MLRPTCLRRHPLAAIVLALACVATVPAQADVFSRVAEINTPAGPGAREPALFALDDDRVVMSWLEPMDTGFAVRVAIRDRGMWSEPRTVVASNDLFVNWADFPSVAGFPDGTLAVHWLRESGTSVYAYDVNVALSRDEGRTWSEPLVPHRDRSAVQHGFATLLPLPDNRVAAIWLDGRAYDSGAVSAPDDAFGNAMQLRATTIGSDGGLGVDAALDVRTCTCCQTSASVTADGQVFVAYRDRTHNEIRDISVVRLVEGRWSEPANVYADGWEISGCPVNGPAIDTNNDRTVVAWFTGAGGVPAVKLAFSDDRAQSFGAPSRVDGGDAAGRVDVVQLSDGSAIVSWVAWVGNGEGLFVCRLRPEADCNDRQLIAVNDAPGSINFPRMILSGNAVYIAWTQPPDRQKRQGTIRAVVAAPR